MPMFTVTTEVRAMAEYRIEATSIGEVIERWNAGGEEWEALVGPVQCQEPFDLWLDDDPFRSSSDIDEHDVEASPEHKEPARSSGV